MGYMRYIRSLEIKKINPVLLGRLIPIKNALDKWIPEFQEVVVFPIESIEIKVKLASLEDYSEFKITFEYEEWEEEEGGRG